MDKSTYDNHSAHITSWDIYEAGEKVTPQQAEAVGRDPQLRKDCQTLLDLQTLGRKGREGNPDVEAELQRFHADHDQLPRHASRRPRTAAIVVSIVSLAAAACLLFLFMPRKTMPDLKPEAALAQLQQPGLPTVTSPKGKDIPIQQQTEHTASIDCTTLREIIQETEDIETLNINVPAGQSACVTLPDGSRVSMYPGSRLTFPTAFVGKQREVMLVGQAYFQVKRNSQQPFVVITDKSETLVTGTEFDVKETGGDCEVTLVTGSVHVTNRNTGRIMRLSPGQQATLSDQSITVQTVDITPYQYWGEGFVFFADAELKEIARTIGCHFGLNVEYRNQECKSLRLRFLFERDASPQDVVDLLDSLGVVQASLQDNRLIIE